jgi:hypothetical protein
MENLAEPAGFDQNGRTPRSAKDTTFLTKMSKPYSEMTDAERLADRMAKNREIDRRVREAQSAASAPAEVRSRRKAAGDALVEFQRIKKEQGIDAASEFVRNKVK